MEKEQSIKMSPELLSLLRKRGLIPLGKYTAVSEWKKEIEEALNIAKFASKDCNANVTLVALAGIADTLFAPQEYDFTLEKLVEEGDEIFETVWEGLKDKWNKTFWEVLENFKSCKCERKIK